MKLAFFIYSLSSGGAERVTANLANYWSNKGWNVTIITIDGVEKDFYRLEKSVDRIALKLSEDSDNSLFAIIANLHRITALRRELKRVRPDIAIGMMTTANVILVLGAIGLRVITIGSERTHPPMFALGKSWEWLRRTSYRFLNALVMQTKESRSWVLEHIRAHEVKVIPNAVHMPLPKIDPIVLPEEFIKQKRKALITVGRFDLAKGFHLLVPIFSELAKEFPDWDLLIVGSGEQQDNLNELIKLSGLENRIKLPGSVGNVGDWYEAADIYVMSSRYEGFPNTLVEAMAHGLPAVSFDCDTGPRDIIRHGIDGLLVENGDVDALSQALRYLMSDSSLRNQFADRAIDVKERFSMRKVTGMWEQLFESLCN